MSTARPAIHDAPRVGAASRRGPARSSRGAARAARTPERVAAALVERAMARGASQAEAYVQVGRQSDVRVRDGAIEDLTQATSKGVGLRVIVRGRLGFAYTSDFEPAALERFVDRTLVAAEVAERNRAYELPRAAELGRRATLAPLFDPAVAALAPDWKIKAALEMERALRAVDPRIKTVDSVGAGESTGELAVVSSEGLCETAEGTSVYLYASPVAEAEGQLQTATWFDHKRFLDDLDAPEQVAREAARRVLRMLGARKIPSERLPVVLEPSVAASFVGAIAAAASGDAVFKGASFLARRLGERIAPDFVSIVDDGLLPRGLASNPFDGEGVATRRNAILERGVLRTFLYDATTAHKAKVQSTGNAVRGYRSLPHVGTHNLFLEAGDRPPEAIIGSLERGLYVTAMLGHGANTVTGEYSRGANGLLIEHGELTSPVQEVTVGGDLLDMLGRIRELGSDLEFRGSVTAPTICFEELAVSGA